MCATDSGLNKNVHMEKHGKLKHVLYHKYQCFQIIQLTFHLF